MKKLLLLILTTLSSVLIFAHAPLLDIQDDKGLIYLSGGYSNGESAAGTDIIIVKDKNYNGTEETYDGKLVIFKGVLDKDGQLVLPKPKVNKYIVIFDGGPGHVKEVKGPKLNDDEKDAWQKAIDNDKLLGVWKSKWLGEVK